MPARQLVFIGGAGMDEALVRAAVAACELTDPEFASGGADGAGWASSLEDTLPVGAAMAERARTAAATRDGGHAPACPCCDPELRALDAFANRGM